MVIYYNWSNIKDSRVCRRSSKYHVCIILTSKGYIIDMFAHFELCERVCLPTNWIVDVTWIHFLCSGFVGLDEWDLRMIVILILKRNSAERQVNIQPNLNVTMQVWTPQTKYCVPKPPFSQHALTASRTLRKTVVLKWHHDMTLWKCFVTSKWFTCSLKSMIAHGHASLRHSNTKLIPRYMGSCGLWEII